MFDKNVLFIICFSGIFATVTTVNHWIINNNNGKIMQKLDSPFFMREPDNLLAFLDQIHYNDFVETRYLKLLRQHEQLMEHLQFSSELREDLIEEAKCAVEYYLIEKRILTFSTKYLKGINFPVKFGEYFVLYGEPVCKNYNELTNGPSSYDHLESFRTEIFNLLKLSGEEGMYLKGEKIDMNAFRGYAIKKLEIYPNSWQSHTIGSFYWRLKGDAKESLECARIAVMLAPRKSKDIALHTLGIILSRMGRFIDADILLTAAVEHEPNSAENHFLLGSILAMMQDFNRSISHFDEAERLEPSLLPNSLPVRNYISCVNSINQKTLKMESYIYYLNNEFKEFKRLKKQIDQHHKKLIEQQVPLGVRYFDTKENNEELLKRGQYCSTRILPNMKEPVLFCDFHSDMQMRLEGKEFDIASLEKAIKSASEAVKNQLSKKSSKFMNNVNMFEPPDLSSANNKDEVDDPETELGEIAGAEL